MLKGVNLGGWLVLEKWITPKVFENTTAEDENDLYEALTRIEIEKRLEEHRDSFITEADFKKISESGCELIRLPIPYTIFGDTKERIGCLTYVDKVFEWAKAYHLKILLDLHTVPGSQNGMDNGGIMGLCTWHMQEKNVDLTLDILKRLGERYGKLNTLFGIEPVNEPIDEKTFRAITYNMPKRYEANIKVSQPVPTDFLKTFYKKVYEVLTPLLKKEQKIVFHDGSRLEEWADFMPQKEYPNVWFDTHMYLNFAKYEMKKNTSFDYISYIYDKFIPALKEAEKYHPILVGEWTIAHRAEDMQTMTSEMLENYYRASASLQMMAFEQTHGWMYFNYRVKSEERPYWDFTKVLEKKLLIYS